MATVAQILPRSSNRLSWILTFLKEELAPYPGRAAVVTRMTLAATLVMILSMTFRIPFGAYGAIYALSISRENPEATVRAVKTIVVGFAFSVLYALVGAMFFLQDPNLRLFWVIATFFVLFYALSATKNYTAVARFGYLLIITIPLWDRQILVELKVEDTLWALGATVLASLITVAVELIYAEIATRDELLQPVADRLILVEDILNALAVGHMEDGDTRNQITRFAMVGTSGLRRTLYRSGYSSEYREKMGATISLVGRLIDIAANMIDLRIDGLVDESNRIRDLAAHISTIRGDILNGRIPGPIELDNQSAASHRVPLIVEMGKVVSQIPEIFVGSVSLHGNAPRASSGAPAFSLFKPDALSNPEHIRFGLKGCLAASLCYVIYNATAWPGISTAITTCFLTALTTVGSSRQKQILRISGAIVGGVIMGIGAEIFILPDLDSIGGFALIFVAATIIAAWFATSSPRLSYFGVQIAVAFYLINLSDFKVRTSLVLGRDRVLGILLGLLMMWLVFDQLWGSSAVVEMKKTVTSNLRLVAQFAREPLFSDLNVATERASSLRESINSNFDTIRALADAVLLEFGASREQDLALRNRIRRWQPDLRLLFITRTVLWKYRVRLPGFELPEPIVLAQAEFDNRLASALNRMADRIDGTGSTQIENLTGAYSQLEQAAQNSLQQQQLTPQVQSFLLLSQRIVALADCLEKEILE